MRGEIMYEMHYLPMDSWAPSKSRRNDEAWFLCLVVRNEVNTTVTFERVALFNLNSQAEAFCEAVHLDAPFIRLDGRIIERIESLKRLIKMR